MRRTPQGCRPSQSRRQRCCPGRSSKSGTRLLRRIAVNIAKLPVLARRPVTLRSYIAYP
jgi:hypothetical protein